jgi:flavin reductase (DIM6/NTAB) family NADH-FMN oxidoreductase RutF
MTLDTADFRDALSRWASGVTIVACRVDDSVVATTVSAFTSLSLDPPLVLIALGPNATVLPFLQPSASFGISVLADDQRRLATVFADPFPVGASPFPDDGDPVIRDSVLTLACTVREVAAGGDHHIVIAAVERVAGVSDAPALVRFRRKYHRLGPPNAP